MDTGHALPCPVFAGCSRIWRRAGWTMPPSAATCEPPPPPPLLQGASSCSGAHAGGIMPEDLHTSLPPPTCLPACLAPPSPCLALQLRGRAASQPVPLGLLPRLAPLRPSTQAGGWVTRCSVCCLLVVSAANKTLEIPPGCCLCSCHLLLTYQTPCPCPPSSSWPLPAAAGARPDAEAAAAVDC